jgi:hypothetical protein
MANRKYIVNGQIFEASGERKAIVNGAILETSVAAGGGWSVTDVDLDEDIFDGQTGVVVTMSSAISATGKKVFLEQGGTYVEQTVTGETTTTVTITVDFGGLSLGAATLCVRNPL